VRNPVEELRTLHARLGLELVPAAARYAAGLAGNVSRTALSAPRAGKWREQNAEAIGRILPLVADTERRLGYSA